MVQEALAGLKVLELGDFISAPYCGKLLAGLGAQVIKAEPPAGDSARRFGPFLKNEPNPEKSGLFLNLNADKKGITLNPETKRGRAILQELVKHVDILVEDLAPQLLEEWGLTYERLQEANPRLIQVSVTSFGLTGPYRDYKAYDLNLAAMGGVAISGWQDRYPLRPPVHQCSYQGGIAGANGAMLAVLARELTGRGQLVDISITEVVAAVHGGRGGGIHAFLEEGRRRLRTGFRTAGPYPWGIFECKDGYISVAAVQGFHWSRTLRLIGEGEIPKWYSEDPRFKDRLKIGREYPEQADALWRPWRMAYTKEELFKLFQENGIPFTPVYTAQEVFQHPHLREREFFVTVQREDLGKVELPGPPYRLSETPWRLEHPAPQLGEHNLEVYCGLLGYSSEELTKLRRLGVL